MLFCIMATFCYGLFSLFMADRGTFISLQLCLLFPSTPTLVIKVLGGEYEYNLFASVTKSSCPSHFFLCSFSSPRKPNQFLKSFTQETGLESRRGIRWKRRHACNPGVLSWWCVLIGDHHDLFTLCLFPPSSMTQRIPTQCFSYEINTSSHVEGRERRLVGIRLVKLKKKKKKWNKRSPSLPCSPFLVFPRISLGKESQGRTVILTFLMACLTQEPGLWGQKVTSKLKVQWYCRRNIRMPQHQAASTPCDASVLTVKRLKQIMKVSIGWLF